MNKLSKICSRFYNYFPHLKKSVIDRGIRLAAYELSNAYGDDSNAYWIPKIIIKGWLVKDKLYQVALLWGTEKELCCKVKKINSRGVISETLNYDSFWNDINVFSSDENDEWYILRPGEDRIYLPISDDESEERLKIIQKIFRILTRWRYEYEMTDDQVIELIHELSKDYAKVGQQNA